MKKILLALILLAPGCFWEDDDDYPYIDPDALVCCRCAGPACPDGAPEPDGGSEDAGDDAGEDTDAGVDGGGP